MRTGIGRVAQRVTGDDMLKRLTKTEEEALAARAATLSRPDALELVAALLDATGVGPTGACEAAEAVHAHAFEASELSRRQLASAILNAIPTPDGVADGGMVRGRRLWPLIGGPALRMRRPAADMWRYLAHHRGTRSFASYRAIPVGEDRYCGSVPGYCDFLDAISEPDKGKGSRKKREMLAWYRRPCDPDDIDQKQARTAVAQIAKAARLRKAPTVKS